jgi:hypothetical protein
MDTDSSCSSMTSHNCESFVFEEIVDIYSIVKNYNPYDSTLFQFIKQHNPKIDNELLKMTLILILVKHEKYNRYNKYEICYICDAIDEINNILILSN